MQNGITVVALLADPSLKQLVHDLCGTKGWSLRDHIPTQHLDHQNHVVITDSESVARQFEHAPDQVVVCLQPNPGSESNVTFLTPNRDINEIAQRIETALNVARFRQQFFSDSRAEPITKLPRHPELLEAMTKRIGRATGVVIVQIDHADHLYANLDPVSKTDLLGALSEHLFVCLEEQCDMGIFDASCFVIWVRDTDAARTKDLAYALLERSRSPIQFKSGQLHLTLSIGYAFEQTLANPQDLWKSAWQAHEKASKQSGDKVIGAEQDTGVESRIPDALARDEFTLVLQPQYSLDGTKMRGVETLLRWEGMEIGNLAPDRFIPIAERSGQMARVGDWVIERASVESTAWLEHLTAPITVGVNTSPHQFNNAGIKAQIERLTKDNWINPATLELELTHDNLLHVVDQHRSTLYALREMGVRIAIDNIGVGLVDTEKLLRCPADTLKIDRSLIAKIETDSNARSLAEHVCKLGERFSLRVVAVGVETEEQKKILAEFGQPDIQGYLYAEPVPLEQFQKFLMKEVARTG